MWLAIFLWFLVAIFVYRSLSLSLSLSLFYLYLDLDFCFSILNLVWRRFAATYSPLFLTADWPCCERGKYTDFHMSFAFPPQWSNRVYCSESVSNPRPPDCRLPILKLMNIGPLNQANVITQPRTQGSTWEGQSSRSLIGWKPPIPFHFICDGNCKNSHRYVGNSNDYKHSAVTARRITTHSRALLRPSNRSWMITVNIAANSFGYGLINPAFNDDPPPPPQSYHSTEIHRKKPAPKIDFIFQKKNEFLEFRQFGRWRGARAPGGGGGEWWLILWTPRSENSWILFMAVTFHLEVSGSVLPPFPLHCPIWLDISTRLKWKSSLLLLLLLLLLQLSQCHLAGENGWFHIFIGRWLHSPVSTATSVTTYNC